ncbi:hypothetical protein [Staphylococcus marylandisciuri]|nr:hypothetical protein [Staphylococcus marylandisciuri]
MRLSLKSGRAQGNRLTVSQKQGFRQTRSPFDNNLKNNSAQRSVTFKS